MVRWESGQVGGASGERKGSLAGYRCGERAADSRQDELPGIPHEEGLNTGKNTGKEKQERNGNSLEVAETNWFTVNNPAMSGVGLPA